MTFTIGRFIIFSSITFKGDIHEDSLSWYCCSRGLTGAFLHLCFLHAGCIHIANHFSHGGLCTNWVECHELYEKEDFQMTYDGLEIEV